MQQMPSEPGNNTGTHAPSSPKGLARGADILVEALAREGVDLVFGYPGGNSMEIHQALTRTDIRCVLCRHEQGEAFAAEGYAKSSGRPGVCLATSGPGATNLVTGLADARMDSVPIVAITGQVPTPNIGRDAFQETPIVEVSRQITKHNYLVDRVEDLPRVVKEAFHIATTGRPGPVLVDVPKDVQQAHAVPAYPDTVSIRSYTPHPRASRDRLEEVARAIRQARRPVIYAGGGIVSSGASAELRDLAERADIPVTLTLMGLGAFPSGHPLCLGMLGMHGTYHANYAVAHADLLIGVGVRFDDRVTGNLEAFARHGRIVHIDIDASELNKNKEAHIPVLSDVRYALQELNGLTSGAEHTPWREAIASERKAHPMAYHHVDGEILPQHAITLLRDLTEGKAIVATGVGQHQMWTAQFYGFDEPRALITSAGLGSMGFGLPAAIGASLANPGRLVVDIDGDGSFLMNVQELVTAHVEDLPIKVMVLNNQHLGMVVQWEDRFYESNRGHTFIGDPEGKEIYPDFVRIAEGCRVPAERVASRSDLPAAMERMLAASGPYVLDVVVPYQEHVLPMIPSGRTFEDIITE